MPEPFKNFFNKEVVENLGKQINDHYSDFNVKFFVKSVINKEWEDLELKERMYHIVEMMHKEIKVDYKESIEILSKISEEFKGLPGLIFSAYVEKYGLENYSVSIPALKLFTVESSAEFAVRPFIIKYPEKMMKQMLKWSKDKNVHVRRLSSEGCRPRLPWAMKLPDIIKDPALVLPILENLKDDKEEYVRKSVANNLNDISKDNPELTLKVFNDWKGNSKNTDWIIKHGARTLLKKGDPNALKIFGVVHDKNIVVEDFSVEDKVKIGENIKFEFKINNKSKKSAKIRIDYKIYYMKKSGKQLGKVFRLTDTEIKKGDVVSFSKKQSFEDRSIRKHYTGEHKVSLVINGVETDPKSFEVI